MRVQHTFRQTISLCITMLLATAFIGCTKPRQTTAVGSGVGGAIGAGLGAIVGNQSGNAGSGLAIGAGAGAAVGALVGNALQAQEEKNRTQDEAIKRQERVIQAQRNEITELRLIRGDDSYSAPASSASTPRYHYRGVATDPESPEVARQRAKLQQRGPNPSNAARSAHPTTYYSYQRQEPQTPPVTRTATRSAPPAATLPATTAPATHKPLARYDIRSELGSEPSEFVHAPAPEPKKPVAQAPTKSSGQINERDIPLPEQPSSTVSRAAPVSPPPQAQSKECKEALAERDQAAEASENSDKLFHLRRALRLCPQSAPLHHELGKVYASMQRTSDAEGEFKQALEIDPSFSAAKRELGSLLKEEVHF